MRRMYSKPQLLEAVEQEAEVNGLKAFENIVDKDGHKRFIEGEVHLDNSVPSGYTELYGKWSLSGTHLLIVIAFSIDNAVNTGYVTTLTTVNIPDWIKNKIVPLGNTYIELKNVYGYASDDSTQQVACQLRLRNDEIAISQSSITMTAKRAFRVAFDLLIDDE